MRPSRGCTGSSSNTESGTEISTPCTCRGDLDRAYSKARADRSRGIVRGVDATPFTLAAATGALGLVAGIVGTAYKSRKALESEYDIDLRKTRIDVYKKLWCKLNVLARYSPPPYSRETVEQLSVALRSWYFEQGGLFMSKHVRNAYFDLQEALAQTLERVDDPASLRRLLVARGSALRTAMSDDVATRVAPKLGGKRGGDVDISDDVRVARTAAEIKQALEAAASAGAPER
jgi:hypothetical protein